MTGTAEQNAETAEQNAETAEQNAETAGQNDKERYGRMIKNSGAE